MQIKVLYTKYQRNLDIELKYFIWEKNAINDHVYLYTYECELDITVFTVVHLVPKILSQTSDVTKRKRFRRAESK